MLRQAESREWFGDAFDYVVEPVLPRVGLGVVDESVGQADLPMIIGEDESKLIPFGRGELDGLRCCSAIYIHTQAYCLVFSFQPTNTVASYCGSPLTFFSRETSGKSR